MRLPLWTVPATVVVAIIAGVGAAGLLTIPTVTLDFAETAPSAHLETLVLIVDGVRCADTARAASSTLEDAPGISRFTAYASYSRLEILYDPSVITREEIVDLLQGPVYDPETGDFRFDVFSVSGENKD